MTKADFRWAVEEATAKKMDFSKVEFMTCEEGLCVQCMHIGSYDDEAQTDAGKVVLEKLKTVVWHPIARW